MVGFKLHKLGSRILRALTPLALSASLIASGCDTPPEPEAVDASIELRASQGVPSKAIVQDGQEIAEGIASDEAFIELVEVTAEVMGDLHRAQQKLSDEHLDAIAVTTSDPSFAEVMGPGALLGHLGGNAKHLDHIRFLIEEILENHDLQDAPPQDVRHVFDLAFEIDDTKDLAAAALADEIAFSVYDPCKQLCINTYIASLVVPLGMFALLMVAATVTFPFGIAIALVAIGMLNTALTLAKAVLDRCLAECDGAPALEVDVDLCGGKDICEKDEYCWSGVLGFGADECRPLRGKGRVCAGPDQCASDCCKLHLSSNPVSKTCRPASACN